MRITTPYGTLMIDANTSIAITYTNPMFNEQGSFSLPFSVPWCEHNLAVLNHPELLSKSGFSKETIPVTISAKSTELKGVIKTGELTRNENIELIFLFNNGGFWEWSKETKLPDITPEPKPHPCGTAMNDPYLGVWLMENYIGKVWPEVELTCFTIAVGSNTDDINSQIAKVDFDDNAFKNELDQDCTNQTEIGMYKMKNSPLIIEGQRAGEERRGIPNLTGFVFVRQILEWIISAKGYRLNICDLNEISELNSLVVLNAAINPFRSKLIFYNEMVPNSTIEEFINAIEKTFFCVFFVDDAEKTVSIRLWKNLLNEPGIIKINGLFDNESIQDNTENTIIKPEVVNDPHSEFVEGITEDEIRAKPDFAEDNYPGVHHSTVAIKEHVKTGGRPGTTTGLPVDLYPYNIRFQKFLQVYFHNIWETEDGTTWKYYYKAFYSLFYPYKSSTDGRKNNTIIPKNIFSCMINNRILQYQFDTDSAYPPTGTDGEEMYFHWFWNLPMVLFDEKYSVKKTTFSNYTIYHKEPSQKISFAFWRGFVNRDMGNRIFRLKTNDKKWKGEGKRVKMNGKTLWQMPWGSTDVYSPLGDKMNGQLPYEPRLNEANIALRFNGQHSLMQLGQEYVDFKRNGFAKAKLYTEDLKLPIDMTKRYMVENHAFFIDKVEFTIDKNGISDKVFDVIITKHYLKN